MAEGLEQVCEHDGDCQEPADIEIWRINAVFQAKGEGLFCVLHGLRWVRYHLKRGNPIRMVDRRQEELPLVYTYDPPVGGGPEQALG